MTNDSAEILFQFFLQEALASSQAWAGMSTLRCCLCNISLPSMVSPTLQGALKDDFGEAVVACHLPEPCKLWSLDSCQKRFLWTHKEVDLVPHPVIGLVLQVGDVEKFPWALTDLVLKDWILFSESACSWSMFHSHRGGWR